MDAQAIPFGGQPAIAQTVQPMGGFPGNTGPVHFPPVQMQMQQPQVGTYPQPMHGGGGIGILAGFGDLFVKQRVELVRGSLYHSVVFGS